jgi:hypothetical protein
LNLSQAKAFSQVQQSLIDFAFKNVATVTTTRESGIGSSEGERIGWSGL